MNIVKVLLSLILFSSQAFGLNTSGVATKSNKTIGQDSKENALLNGDFEDNTYGTILVNAGATSIAKDLNSGIFGHALKVTSPSNTAEIKFGIDTNKIQKLNGLNCEAKFNLKLFSSNLTPTVVNVDVVQGTSTVLSNVQQISLGTSGIWVPMSVNFPCGSVQSASYARITITSAGTVASGSVSFIVDSLYVGEATNITNQVVVTDWQDFPSVAAGTLITATTTNPTYGTVVTNKAQWRRVGGNMEIRWDFRQSTAGTGGSGQYLLNLPPGFQIDTNKVKASNNFANFVTEFGDSSVGTLYFNDLNYTGIGLASVYSTTQLRFAFQIAAGATTAASAWASTFGQFNNGAQSASVIASVPIVGWSATQSAITQQCIQDGSCENRFSAFIDGSTGAVTGENIDWINGNCTRNSIGNYTCNFKAGLFGATPACTGATFGTVATGQSIAFPSQNSSSIIFTVVQDGVSFFDKSINLKCERSGTDYKPRFAAPVLVGSVTSNSQSALRIESVMFTCGGSSSITRQTGNFIASIGSISSGDCVLNFTSQFTSPPFCIHTGLQAGNGFSYTISSDPLVSSVTARCSSSGGPCGGYSGYVTCIGAR